MREIKKYRFIGNGDRKADTSLIHLEQPLEANFTICALAINYKEDYGDVVKVRKSVKVTCPDCLTVINACLKEALIIYKNS